MRLCFPAQPQTMLLNYLIERTSQFLGCLKFLLLFISFSSSTCPRKEWVGVTEGSFFQDIYWQDQQNGSTFLALEQFDAFIAQAACNLRNVAFHPNDLETEHSRITCGSFHHKQKLLFVVKQLLPHFQNTLEEWSGDTPSLQKCECT